MGKSAVLKDLSNRAAGYVILSGENVLCRAQLDAPARLVLVFSEEADGEYTLAADGAEQRFPCREKSMCGCYVIQKEELLLISDEGMRREFEKRMRKSRADDLRRRRPGREPERQPLDKTQPEEKPQTGQRLPQRRWPPSPCWDAVYRDGSWQDE